MAKHSASKGPLYNAIGRFFNDVEPKVRALSEVQRELDSLDQKIEAAEGTLVRLEERKSNLTEQIETLETKVAKNSEFIKQVGELEKLGFNIERLRQLRDALTQIGAKHSLKGKEAASRFFDDLKDYEAILEAELQLKGLETQIETKKLQAENWQAKEETLRRKHDDLTEDIGAVHALRAKGIKVGKMVAWNRIVNQIESIEQFEEKLRQYGDMAKLLNARKEETKGYELRLAQVKSQVETLEKEKAKIEAAIDALKTAGVKQLKAMTEAAEKQLKVVAAREIEETRAVGQEVRSEFSNYFAHVDQLVKDAFQIGQKFERLKKKLRKYEGVKDALE